MAVLSPAMGETVFEETFDTLDRWEPWTFDSIPRHSTYEVVEGEDGQRVLLMKSDNASSGLVLKERFEDVEDFRLSWRWRVDEAIRDVDHSRRSGDDYPIRIYIFFEYVPDGLSLGERIRYRAYRALRGEYPPHSGMSFVWTAMPVEESIYPNPYTDRMAVRVLRGGTEAKLGVWYEESVDLREAYEAYPGCCMKYRSETVVGGDRIRADAG